MPTLDLSAQDPLYRVVGEQHVLNECVYGGAPHIIAKVGPFFASTLTVVANKGGLLVPFILGVDFRLTFQFKSAVDRGVALYGGIVLNDTATNYTVSISYQRIGDKYSSSRDIILNRLATLTLFRTPFSLVWEDVTSGQNYFEEGITPVRVGLGYGALVEATLLVASRIVSGTPTVSGIMQVDVGGTYVTHLNDLNNPHGLTANDLNLGAVANLSVVSDVDLQQNNGAIKYVTSDLLRRLPTLTTPIIVASTQDSVVLSISVTLLNGFNPLNGIVATQYKPSTTNTWQTKIEQLTLVNTPTSGETLFTGLLPNTHYDFRLVVISDNTVITTSNVASVLLPIMGQPSNVPDMVMELSGGLMSSNWVAYNTQATIVDGDCAYGIRGGTVANTVSAGSGSWTKTLGILEVVTPTITLTKYNSVGNTYSGGTLGRGDSLYALVGSDMASLSATHLRVTQASNAFIHIRNRLDNVIPPSIIPAGYYINKTVSTALPNNTRKTLYSRKGRVFDKSSLLNAYVPVAEMSIDDMFVGVWDKHLGSDGFGLALGEGMTNVCISNAPTVNVGPYTHIFGGSVPSYWALQSKRISTNINTIRYAYELDRELYCVSETPTLLSSLNNLNGGQLNNYLVRSHTGHLIEIVESFNNTADPLDNGVFMRRFGLHQDGFLDVGSELFLATITPPDLSPAEGLALNFNNLYFGLDNTTTTNIYVFGQSNSGVGFSLGKLDNTTNSWSFTNIPAINAAQSGMFVRDPIITNTEVIVFTTAGTVRLTKAANGVDIVSSLVDISVSIPTNLSPNTTSILVAGNGINFVGEGVTYVIPWFTYVEPTPVYTLSAALPVNMQGLVVDDIQMRVSFYQTPMAVGKEIVVVPDTTHPWPLLDAGIFSSRHPNTQVVITALHQPEIRLLPNINTTIATDFKLVKELELTGSANAIGFGCYIGGKSGLVVRLGLRLF